MDNIVVKDHLTEICRDRGISIAELCRRTGLNRAGVYRRNNFSLTNICKMLVVLNCKFEDLFEIVEQ